MNKVVVHSALLLAVACVLAPGVAAQVDRIVWTDGTVTPDEYLVGAATTGDY